jgi:pyruvate formate lyase activating enzyme
MPPHFERRTAFVQTPHLTNSRIRDKLRIVVSGLVTNIQRYSLQDGPGIRTTVFLKGCPLDCWWCHNPEGLASEQEIVRVESRCLRCGECIEACPQEIARLNSESEDRAACAHCGACVRACPTGARQFAGLRMTVEDVMQEIIKDSIFHDDSSGGVTFSGGEPLLQPEFLLALLRACHHAGVHTAVDTCGFVKESTLLQVAALADLILFDLKILDDARHRKFTGVSNQVILENLREVCRKHANVWLRVPLIPGINDASEELGTMAQFAASLSSIRQVNLLPYHRTGVQKFQRFGRDYRLPDVMPPSAAEIQAATELFVACGLRVKVGG